jgi:hypothetical protein
MIYVDDAVWPYGRMVMCHMIADSVDELHAFAGQLGLRRDWFQHKPGKTPHYDICKTKRATAIELGAKPIGRSEFQLRANELRNRQSGSDRQQESNLLTESVTSPLTSTERKETTTNGELPLFSLNSRGVRREGQISKISARQGLPNAGSSPAAPMSFTLTGSTHKLEVDANRRWRCKCGYALGDGRDKFLAPCPLAER